MLELDHLSKRYGELQALRDLSLTVREGEIFGFVGANGAGKTTTMRAVLGVLEVDTGSVQWNGAEITFPMRRRIGYIPEDRGLYPKMTVLSQLDYFGRLHGLKRHDARTASMHWLERLGLADRAGSQLQSLSHGNQQRVQLAAALVHEPELIVLDEPLSGLDPVGIDDIGAVLVERANAGCCVVFSSHQLDLVEDLCESVTIIDHGRLVTSGRVDDLATSGARRLVVRVEGDRDAAWAKRLAGVVVSEVNGGEARLVLDESIDSDVVLRAAMAAGRVTEFSFARRRLSEVFREALA